ncbi:hypothetical protein SLA2020_503320 [Shorea laevis]
MGRSERKSRKQRRKRTRSSSFVYKISRREAQHPMETKQNNPRKDQKLDERMLIFCPDAQKQVTDASIADSGIENRNRCLRDKANSSNGEQIWGFAKKIGVVDCENEEEVVRRLNAMEVRDREMYKKAEEREVDSRGENHAKL